MPNVQESPLSRCPRSAGLGTRLVSGPAGAESGGNVALAATTRRNKNKNKKKNVCCCEATESFSKLRVLGEIINALVIKPPMEKNPRKKRELMLFGLRSV